MKYGRDCTVAASCRHVALIHDTQAATADAPGIPGDTPASVDASALRPSQGRGGSTRIGLAALLALAALFPAATIAQTCTNLFTGDNGGSFGIFPAPTSAADYQFRDLTNPPSGGYTFASDGVPSLSGEYLVTSGAFANKIFGGGNHWANMLGHTSAASNDGFLAVNGSGTQGQTFYSQTMTLSAGQTTIRLWAANAVVDTNPNSLPNVGVRLVSVATGTVVAGFNASTGVMPSRANNTSQQWFPAEATANVPATGSYRLEIYNNSTASGGNDFIVDDITVAPQSQDCAKFTVIKTVLNDNGGTDTASNFGIQSRAVRAGNSVGFTVPATLSGTTSTYVSDTYAFLPDGGTEWLLELNRPAYTEGTWSCTGDGVVQAGTVFNNGGFTIPRGRNATCRISNDDIAPVITVTKVSNGGVGTFSFTGTNGFTAHSITTVTAGTAVAGPQRTLTTAAATTITEAAPPAGFTLTAINCSGLGATGTTTVDLNARNVVLNAAAVAAGSSVACTFTNSASATLQLAKAWAANSVAGHVVTIGATTGGSNNTVAFNATAPNAANSGAAVAVNVGNVVTLPAETGANVANYTTTLACTGGHTLSGSNGQQSNTLTITSTNAAVCTYTNTLNQADLSVTKTNNATVLNRGSQTTYVVTVRNGGPAAANGAVVRDTPVSNLSNCSVTACAPVGATPAAACPATPADLLTPAGAVLGPFAANNAVEFSVQCTVN